MKVINRLLRRFGVLLVPVPADTRTLRKMASAAERGFTADGSMPFEAYSWATDWIRAVALADDEAHYHYRESVIRNWRCRCGRLLGEDGRGCAWHVNARAQALTGESTEEQCR
jgi:hypothetical protein